MSTAYHRGQILVMASLLEESLRVVKNVEAEGSDESELLQALIARSEAAVKAMLLEHALQPSHTADPGPGTMHEHQHLSGSLHFSVPPLHTTRVTIEQRLDGPHASDRYLDGPGCYHVTTQLLSPLSQRWEDTAASTALDQGKKAWAVAKAAWKTECQKAVRMEFGAMFLESFNSTGAPS